ncbi:MAG: hypothetical protein ABH846_02180 [Patescibacteria group bacterium]
MKHLPSIIVGIILGAAITIVTLVIVLLKQPQIEKSVVIDADEPTESSSIADEEIPVEPIVPRALEEIYAGDGASCVYLWDDFDALSAAQANGYIVSTVAGYNLETTAELVEACKTQIGGHVQLYMQKSLNDTRISEYIWDILVSDDGKNWEKLGFVDNLPSVLAPTCGVDLIINDSKNNIRFITTECVLGDGGPGKRNGYVIDRVDQSDAQLYKCNFSPDVIIHPETHDVLYERFIDDCEVLYL